MVAHGGLWRSAATRVTDRSCVVSSRLPQRELSLAGCSSFSVGLLQIDPADRAGPARLDAAGRRCRDLARTGLQDALLGRVPAPEGAFHGHLHPEQVPAGHRPGACDPHPRRFLDSGVDHDRSQSGGRGTSAGGPPPKPARRSAPAEAKAPRPPRPQPPRNRRSRTRRQRRSGSGAPHRPAAARADCLHCTTTDPSKVADCAASQHAYIVLARGVTDIAAAARKAHLNERRRCSTPARVAMTDPFGRTISYLRVSVTDRCDLRCFYCMSEDMTFLPKADLLDARGARPAVFGIHRQGREEAAADRRRTAGPAQCDVAGALAVAPSRHRRARMN